MNDANYNFLLMSTAVIIAFTFFLIWVILLYQAMWIFAKYTVILRAVCLELYSWWSSGGTFLERVKTTTFRLLINPLLAPFRITLLILWLWVTSCHDRSISEPAAIKIIWPPPRARYYCWRASFGLRVACFRPLRYDVPLPLARH